jgi:excisionase family DNA binding protein
MSAPKAKPDCDALSIADVCKNTGLGRTTVYAAIAEGRLRARKLGRRTLVLRDDFTQFLVALPEIKPISRDG